MACRILLLTVALLWAQPLSARPRAADPIRELLAEVRLLRRTLERSATTGTRIQLLVARVPLQEQRISDVSRKLDGARSELRDLERGPWTRRAGSSLRSKRPPIAWTRQNAARPNCKRPWSLEQSLQDGAR